MNKPTRAKSSTLFLMELILSILFFAIAAAVCLNLFAGARKISRRSYLLSKSTTHCSSVAEIIRSADTTADVEVMMATVYGSSLYGKITLEDSLEMPLLYGSIEPPVSDFAPGSSGGVQDVIRTGIIRSHYVVFFDDEFALCSEGDASVYLICDLTESSSGPGMMLSADVRTVDGNPESSADTIYEFHVEHYVSGKEAYRE